MLDDVGDLLKSVFVFVLSGVVVGYYQESLTLEEDDLVRAQGLTENLQVFFEDLNVGEQEGDNL